MLQINKNKKLARFISMPKLGINSFRNGFTLVELLVGLAIFSSVIVIATSLFVSTFRNQRKSIAILNVQENGRYLMEFIAKEIRMSQIISSDGETFNLDISHPVNGDITYSFSNNHILRNGEIIDSDEVNINGRFFIDGRGADAEQPRVVVVMKLETTGQKIEERATMNLETTLSQRNLD